MPIRVFSAPIALALWLLTGARHIPSAQSWTGRLSHWTTQTRKDARLRCQEYIPTAEEAVLNGQSHGFFLTFDPKCDHLQGGSRKGARGAGLTNQRQLRRAHWPACVASRPVFDPVADMSKLTQM